MKKIIINCNHYMNGIMDKQSYINSYEYLLFIEAVKKTKNIKELKKEFKKIYHDKLNKNVIKNNALIEEINNFLNLKLDIYNIIYI